MARVVSYLFVSAAVLACLGLRADAQGGYMPSVAVLVHLVHSGTGMRY